MVKSFYVDYNDTPFLQTSKAAAPPNRLNWRCEILLTRNEEAVRGKRILDLASHDGRFSYACLKLGASHVVGVEGRLHLVEFANKNLTGLGYKPEQFDFIQGDIFDYLAKVKPNEFDTILCFGLFYHIVRQNELISEIKRIQPEYFVLDTSIALGISPGYPVGLAAQGQYHKAPFSWLKQRLEKLRFIAKLLITSPSREVPCLLFLTENHELEGATIDPMDLIAWPTKSFIELVFKSYGFSFNQLEWNNKEIKNWANMEDYKIGMRVSYIAQTSKL